MREQSAAARGLPPQVRPELVSIDGQEEKPAFPREMLGERAFELVGGGEMDEAVAEIVSGARVASDPARLGQGKPSQDFVDDCGHAARNLAARARSNKRAAIAQFDFALLGSSLASPSRSLMA